MISPTDILNARILIVDDQEANISLLEQILCEAGYTHIWSTKDPHEVRELYRINRYSLILLDLKMPVMDGYQVMQGLMEIEVNGYLPVLAITAQLGQNLLALKAGAKDFVSKPFDLEELLVRVQNMLEVRLLNVEVNKLNGRLIAEDALLQDEIGERNRIADTLRRAQAQLSGYAGQLEGLVAERTSELAAANKKLEASVSIVQKANNEHQALFLESNGMREKLSQLTRQIIRAQEEMRKEISRELHDGVVQSLIAVGVQLAALGKGASLEARNVKRISNIRKLVEKSVIEVHRFARELRPSVLDDLGLVPALIAYNKSLAERKKIKISMTVFVGVEALGDDQRTMLFRVAQEALANVVRHARATQVKMSICEIPDAVRMEISDNGRSFLVEKVVSDKNPKRLGLVGMKERVEMVGGQLTIVSERSRGTTVRVEIPFARKQMAGVPEAN